MAYIIELLHKHGIQDIAVTMQYKPDVIRDYFGDGEAFGVNLHYFEEMSPLGTAGSVKQAHEFLDDTFVVISGDALTDFDLEQALAFHKEKASQSYATADTRPSSAGVRRGYDRSERPNYPLHGETKLGRSV